MRYRQSLLAPPGRRLALDRADPSHKGQHLSAEAAKADLDQYRHALSRLQPLLYAQRKWSVLIVLQAMDAGGKDGTVNHVLGALNPQGTRVVSFGPPTPREAAHDFLWRIHPHAPARGEIMVFNRSHYEDVLVPRVHHTIDHPACSRRYQRIREFEQELVENDTVILKFFLHISKKEQLDRFAARLDDPHRNWKISEADYTERAYWDDYISAYEDAIGATSTTEAPWFVIPANHKWFRNLAVSQIIVDALTGLNMSYPQPRVDLAEIRRRFHAEKAAESVAGALKRNGGRDRD